MMTSFCFVYIYIYMQCYHLHYACRALNSTTCEFSRYHSTRCIVRCMWKYASESTKQWYTYLHKHTKHSNLLEIRTKAVETEVSTADYKEHMQSIYCQLDFRVKSVLQNTDWCLLWFFLGYRRVTWSGESSGGRATLHCLSSWGTLGETASEIHPGWEWKNTGTDRVDLGFSVVNTGKRKGEMHSYLFEVMDKAKAQGQNGTVQKGCNPAGSFCVAWTKQGSRDRPGRTQIVVAKDFLPCLWLLCTLTQLFHFLSV